jgi:hypothetical protein
MIASLKRFFSRIFGKGQPPAEDRPPGMSESGAGMRHGQAPPNYVPPADEGRPPH